jgi:hypothetical protein
MTDKLSVFFKFLERVMQKRIGEELTTKKIDGTGDNVGFLMHCPARIIIVIIIIDFVTPCVIAVTILSII